MRLHQLEKTSEFDFVHSENQVSAGELLPRDEQADDRGALLMLDCTLVIVCGIGLNCLSML
jgi:hypothetical protein